MSLSDLLSELMQRTEIPSERDMLWLDPAALLKFQAACFSLFALGSVRRTARIQANQRMEKNSVSETVRLMAG
jgi:hypothetical protein